MTPVLPESGAGEPVVNTAKVVAVVVAVAPVLALVLGLVGIADPQGTTDQLVDGITAAVGGVGAVVNLVVPIVRARRLRGEVTPNGAVAAYRTDEGALVAGEASGVDGERLAVLPRPLRRHGDRDPVPGEPVEDPAGRHAAPLVREETNLDDTP